MTVEKTTVLPPIHGPIIQKDHTVWPDNTKAKISVDVSSTLFSTLQDYNTCFSLLDISYSTVEQIATKETKEYKNLRASIEHEVMQLKELIKQTQHYKALVLMESIDNSVDVKTLTPEEKTERSKLYSDVTIAQAAVILEQKEPRLSPGQLKILDNYYRLVLQDRTTAMQKEKILVDEQPKQITITHDHHNIVDELFVSYKKPKKQEQQQVTKPAQQGSRFGIFKKNSSENLVEKNTYRQPIGIITIKTAYGSKQLILAFCDSGQKLRNQLV